MTRYVICAAAFTAALLWVATHPEQIEAALARLLDMEDQ